MIVLCYVSIRMWVFRLTRHGWARRWMEVLTIIRPRDQCGAAGWSTVYRDTLVYNIGTLTGVGG